MARDVGFLVPGGAVTGVLARELLDARTPPDSLEPGTELGPFTIQRLLGCGGAGAVYLARRSSGFEQLVALKVVRTSSSWRQRFALEQDTLGRLNHHAIVRIFDAGETQAHAWLAMEYVSGHPIDTHLEMTRLPWRERIALLIEVCRALAHAHREMVVHGDLKPGNILVDESGQPKLVDFGIATDLRRDGEPVGRVFTPMYASPEQLTGGRIGVASDIWQCGRLIDRLCLQARGEDGERGGTVVPSWERRDLAAIVARATAEDPAGRYEGMGALADDLVACLDRRRVSARRLTRGYALTCLMRRNRIVFALSGTLVLAGIAAFAAIVHQSRLAHESAATAHRATQFVVSLIEAGNPETGAAEYFQSVDSWLEAAAERAERELDDLPLAQAELRSAIGIGLAVRGRIEEGIELLERSVAQYRDLGPRAQLPLGKDLGRLAIQYRSVGRLDESWASAEEARTLLESLGPAGRRQLIGVRTTLARLAGQRGAYELQFELNRETLAMRSALLGENDPALAVDWHNLGTVLLYRSRYDESRQAFERALALLDGNAQASRSRRAWPKTGLAELARTLGDYRRAGEQIDEAERIVLDTLHERHGMLATIWQARASLYNDLGRYEEALAEAQRADANHVENRSPDRFRALYYAGQALLALGRAEQALAVLTESHQLAEETRGADDVLTRLVEAARLAATIRSGDASAITALQAMVDLLADERQRFPVWYANGIEYLADSEAWLGNAEAAAAARRLRLEVLSTVFPPAHPKIVRLREQLGH